MHFTYDRFGRQERPQLVLCELSKERLGVINDIALNMSIRWTDISEVRFTVSSVMPGGGRYELFEDVRELRLVHITNFGYFQIRDVNEVSDGIRLVKECVAYSIESMLQSKLVIELEGEYRLFDPISPNETLMGIIMNMIPGWRIGNVDGALLVRWRTMNVTQQNLYTLLVNDIATAYECLFIFDYENLTIDIIDKAREFQKTSIFMSYQNLIKDSRVQVLTDNIVTALHVRGGNLDITGVNPSGTDVIYNVDYFKDRMSAGLLAALLSYEALYHSLQPLYTSLLLQLRNANQTLALQLNNPPPYEVTFNASADGTANIVPALNPASGLNQLEALRRALEGVKSVRIEHGNIPFTDINMRIGQVNPLIATRRTQIASTTAQIDNLIIQIRNVVNQLRIENHFTEAQWIELNRYFIYDIIQEDGFIWTDIMTEAERQDIQQELFDFGNRALVASSVPKFEIEIDSVNFPALPEFSYFTEQFRLGTTFTLDLGHYKVTPLLLEVNLDFEDLTNFSLVYANQFTLETGFSDIDNLGRNSNASNTISFNLTRLEAMRRSHDDVTEFINGALDASRNELISSSTRTAITIDEHGLRARSYNWNTGLPTGLEAWLTGSQFAFSDNSFTTARLALGRIQAPGSAGGMAYGLVADVIVGRILAGNTLHITNIGNNFRLDETGAWLENASFTLFRTIGGVRREITLDPNFGLRFRNGAQDVITMDINNGNATFAGQINGGSININNRFMVDSAGNVTITSGSININNRFIADAMGNVTMAWAHITGGAMQLGGTEITEGWFRTINGTLSSFFNSNFDASNNIHGGAIQHGTLNGGAIQANTITANQIQAGSINAGHIQAGSISSGHIQAGAISAGQIQTNAIMAHHIMSGSITADKIQTNAILAHHIMSGSITADKIAANAINANMITTGVMSADRILGGSMHPSHVFVSGQLMIASPDGQLNVGFLLVELRNRIIALGG